LGDTKLGAAKGGYVIAYEKGKNTRAIWNARRILEMGYKAFYSGNALAVEISVKIFERRALT